MNNASSEKNSVNNELIPAHFRALRESALNDETIAAMGCYSVLPRDVPGLENGEYAMVDSALAFPYPGVNGFARYRLDPPIKYADGGKKKYHQQSGTPSHVYILPAVRAILSNPDIPLGITEGEKKAACLTQHGIPTVGIGGVWNWLVKGTPEMLPEFDAVCFADRSILIFFDSDAWRKEKESIGQALYALGKAVEHRGGKVEAVIIPPDDTGSDWGADDFIKKRGIGKFRELKRIKLRHDGLAQFKPWYEKWKAEKVKDQDDGGKVLFLVDDEPWSDSVDTAELLELLAGTIRRYVAAPNDAVYSAALWILHAWALNAFDISPFLFLTSATKRCGKTTMLDVIRGLSPRSLATGNITGPATFRVIEQYKPTLIIDEADTFLADKDDLRGILNAGHRRNTAFVNRLVGDQHEVKLFSVWAPKAIAAIGKLANTLEDRSIIIQMKRRAPGETVQRFRSAEFDALALPLRRRAARWAQDNIDALRNARPQPPESLNDRAVDNWAPLVAVADLAGGEWPRRAEQAALSLAGEIDEAEGSALVDLLKELKALFKTRDRISSADLVARLTADPDSRWADWRHGQPINQRQVARLLSSVTNQSGRAIRSDNIRLGDKIAKGYYSEWFEDAFKRYLPEIPPSDPLQAQQVNDNGLGAKNDPLQSENVADLKTTVTPRNNSDVTVVADKKGVPADGVVKFNGTGPDYVKNGHNNGQTKHGKRAII